MSIHVDHVIPRGWKDLITPGDPVGIGVDLATTEKKKSNPSAIAVVQRVSNDFFARLVLRFKTSDPDITEALIRKAHELPHGLRARKTCIDATNERFFATNLRRKLMGTAVVALVVSSESTTYLGEKMNFKTYLGNLFVNTIDDGRLALPPETWLEKDIRQVVRDRGMFDADVDEEGNHADSFDAIKLALHALIGTASGPVEAHAAPVGTFTKAPAHWPVAGRRNPTTNLF
ncbi:MAG TPA: hypothetical protein PKC67_02380 [Kiritimatiellia bacterium]|nr:hypothetical protein [Kiritimatiellia bacterium]HMP33172.1 hypothetical protein [Kiritimatiellia bacterium]